MAEQWNSQSVKKFFAFGVLLFLLTFVWVFLRDIKDVLIITVPGGGAPLLVALKSYAIWLKILLFVLFLVVYRRDNLPQLMFFTLLLFMVFFIGFHWWGQSLGLLAYKIYYVMADLWGVLAIGFFFWVLANQTFDTKEARWAYPLFSLFGTVGVFLAGRAVEFDPSLIMKQTGLLLTGIFLALLFWSWMMKRWITPLPSLARAQEIKVATPPSFKWIYLGLILIILSAFCFCHHVLQATWKAYIAALYPTPEGYTYFLGQFYYYSAFWGILVFFLTFWMVQVFGWLKSALIPPLMVFLMLLAAVLCQRVPSIAQSIESIFHLAPASGPFWILVAQQIILSGITPTLFVATKEMAYIPLGTTTKARGKAFIDLLLGNKIGIFFGGYALQALHYLSPGGALSPEISLNVLFLVLGVAFLWILAVFFLGRLYKRITPQTLS